MAGVFNARVAHFLLVERHLGGLHGLVNSRSEMLTGVDSVEYLKVIIDKNLKWTSRDSICLKNLQEVVISDQMLTLQWETKRYLPSCIPVCFSNVFMLSLSRFPRFTSEGIFNCLPRTVNHWPRVFHTTNRLFCLTV